MQPVPFFSVQTGDDIFINSDNINPNTIFQVTTEAIRLLSKVPLSYNTIKFSFNNGGGDFHCLAIVIDNYCAAYSIRDENIRVLAIKNYPPKK